ncbi:MAG: hypothetical protein ACO4AY_06295 [Ilumatobacteraceae bacterium]
MNPVRRLADVIEFPLGTAGVVDDLGRDRDVVERALVLGRLRWQVSVGGLEHLPKRSGALIVVNSRRFALSPILSALAIGEATGRPVRFVGRPDVAPLGPLLQRLGGLLPLEPDIRGALRAGGLVVLGAAPSATNAACGVVDHRLVGAAVATKSWVVPAAAVSFPTRRAARVELGQADRSARTRRGPLAELELADRIQDRIGGLLEASGARGTPLDWLPLDTAWGR